jgi:protein-tyrosine-phosphatase
MREHGIDISGRRSKHLEECPEFGGHPQLIHWSFADPDGEADVHAAFRRVAAGLRTRIGFLLAPIGE